MIPVAQITNWRRDAPWANDDDVEQDLLISRAVVDLFNDPFLYQRLAFRGGTALHKLMLVPATRYSEDIDLVYLRNEPIGQVFDHIRDALSWFELPPRFEIGIFPKLHFRFVTASGVNRRIKVEIATREAFSAERVIDVPYRVASTYFTGQTRARTFAIEELLATKLRAHLQRNKGRDLYDLWYAATQRTLDFAAIFRTFLGYWDATAPRRLTRDQVQQDFDRKKRAGIFGQVAPLLVPGTPYEPGDAAAWFEETVLPLFPPAL